MSELSTAFSDPFLSEARSRVESALEQFSCFGEGCPAGLEESIRYSLLAPGKRLRPTLVCLAAVTCGGSLEEALPAACAVEMIHCYSLIHDDLPAMDDDALRRGRATNHVVFGEANAILAGDSLIPRAFEILSREIPDPLISQRCVLELSQAAGATRLVGGQFDDLAGESQEGTLEELEAIHLRKTGALLRASLKLGGVVATASDAEIEHLDEYGWRLGLAFQITDDLLDLQGNAEELGKEPGMDEKRGKLTYPALLGVAESELKSQRLIEEACRYLEPFGEKSAGLKAIAKYVLQRSK